MAFRFSTGLPSHGCTARTPISTWKTFHTRTVVLLSGLSLISISAIFSRRSLLKGFSPYSVAHDGSMQALSIVIHRRLQPMILWALLFLTSCNASKVAA